MEGVYEHAGIQRKAPTKMLRMIREGKSSVAFNPKACDVFDFLNDRMQWNGLHAKNGKEKVVDVFFLDYYEPSLNVAIEWDEKHHLKAKRRQRDGWKSKVVMNTIGCEFYRVNDVCKQVKKIDHSNTDRTEKLQQVINEYYELKS
jgi:very-short-patch-repair endonuclease